MEAEMEEGGGREGEMGGRVKGRDDKNDTHTVHSRAHIYCK